VVEHLGPSLEKKAVVEHLRVEYPRGEEEELVAPERASEAEMIRN
jgi:hypothetical protein